MSSGNSSEVRVADSRVVGRVHDGVLNVPGVCYGSRLDRSSRSSPLGPPHTAQRPAGAFPQTPGLLDGLLGPALRELPVDEDAFTLRVQTPADAVPGDDLPVLLFVHGGGFLSGSGECRWYNATRLVQGARLVLVTVTYRIGAAGSLEGPCSWEDLVQASHWTVANIAAFGGDPANVTIGGDSAGAWWAHALSVLPDTAGLFTRTLLVSMPRLSPLSLRDHEQRRSSVLKALGGRSVDSASMPELLTAQQEANLAYSGQGFPFAPAEGDRLPAWLGDPTSTGARLHTSAVLALTTASEAAAFLRAKPAEAFSREWVEAFARKSFRTDAIRARWERLGSAYEAAVAAVSAWQFESVVQDLAGSAPVPVRWLRLDVASPLERALSPHCFLLPFLFGERAAWADAPMLATLPQEVFEQTRVAVQKAVADFVTNGSGTVPAYDPRKPRLLAIKEGGADLVEPVDLVGTSVTHR